MKSENVSLSNQNTNTEKLLLGSIVGSTNLGVTVSNCEIDAVDYDSEAPLNRVTKKMSDGVEYVVFRRPTVKKVVLAFLGLDEKGRMKGSEEGE